MTLDDKSERGHANKKHQISQKISANNIDYDIKGHILILELVFTVLILYASEHFLYIWYTITNIKR